MMRQIALGLVILGAIACLPAAAQEKDPLFDKGYVTDILQGKGEEVRATPTPKAEKDSEEKDTEEAGKADPNAGATFTEVGPQDATPTPEPSAEEEIAMSDMDGGIEISSIGAVLSAKDSGHYKKSLDQLIDVAIDASVRLDTIYSMGTIEEVFVPVAAQMKDDSTGRRYFEIADKIQLSEKVPSPYDTMVKRSPTWIISTPKGKYVLEGLEPLKKYVTKRGKLVRVDEIAEAEK